MTRGSWEFNPVFSQWAMALYLLIQCLWWLYNIKVFWIKVINCVQYIPLLRESISWLYWEPNMWINNVNNWYLHNVSHVKNLKCFHIYYIQEARILLISKCCFNNHSFDICILSRNSINNFKVPAIVYFDYNQDS